MVEKVAVTQEDLRAADRWKGVWGSFAERLPAEDLAYAFAQHRIATAEACARIAEGIATAATTGRDGTSEGLLVAYRHASREIATAIRLQQGSEKP